MTTAFFLFGDFKRSYITVQPTNATFNSLFEYLIPCSKKRIPDDVTFKVAKGKKFFDIINYHEAENHHFYSQRLIDLLSEFVDMSDKCYPINIEGIEEKYYMIYNLPEYKRLNREKAMNHEEPRFFSGKEIIRPLYGLENGSKIAVSEEVMNHLIKNKVSNARFCACYISTEEEYKDWQKNQKENFDFKYGDIKFL